MAEKVKDNEPNIENSGATPTEDKPTENKPVEKIVYKLLKNIKYGNGVYKAGEKIEITENDLEEFKKAKVIEIEEE